MDFHLEEMEGISIKRYYASSDVEIKEGKLERIRDLKKIDLDGIKVIQLFLIFNVGETTTEVYLGYIQLDDLKQIKWSNFNKAKFVEVQDNVLSIYIDFKDLFKGEV